jgi:hypothetical protein
MALITSISNFLQNLRTFTLTQVTNIVDARFRGDTEATKANKEYHYNNIAGYLKALGWSAYWKNTLYVKLDAPDDFNGSDSMIFQTAQEAVDAIPTVGVTMPTAINPYVIIGDPLVDFSVVSWAAHIAAGTYPFILTTTIGGTGSAESNKTVKLPVRAATTAALPACTYDNTTGTLTADAVGALTAQDGVTLIDNDPLLVKDQVSGLQNGIYDVTQAGTAGTPFILTRRNDANSDAKIVSGILVPVSGEGAVNGERVFMMTTANPIVLGTTALVFEVPRPNYLEYSAIISQNGTNAPTATVLKNTLGGTVVWTRQSQGSYVATLANAFSTSTTLVIVSPNTFGIQGRIPMANVNTGDTIRMATYDNLLALQDGISNSYNILIKVYR